MQILLTYFFFFLYLLAQCPKINTIKGNATKKALLLICLYCGGAGDKGGALTLSTWAIVERLGKSRLAWAPEGVRSATKNGKKTEQKF